MKTANMENMAAIVNPHHTFLKIAQHAGAAAQTCQSRPFRETVPARTASEPSGLRRFFPSPGIVGVICASPDVLIKTATSTSPDTMRSSILFCHGYYHRKPLHKKQLEKLCI